MIKKLSFLGIFILCQSCMDDATNECVNVLIHNETPYVLKIEGFKNGKSIKSIEIGSKLTDKKLVNVFGLDTFLGVNSSQIDSVTLVFDNKRVIVQYCKGKSLAFCDNIKKNTEIEFGNRFSVGSYKTFKKDGCWVFKKPIEITFDQSDFDRAVPIAK